MMNQLFFQHLLQQNKDIVMLIGNDGRIIDANENALNAYAYTIEELTARNIKDLLAPDIVLDVSDLTVKSAENAATTETLQQNKHGDIFPVEIVSRSARIGEEETILLVIHDFSEPELTENDKKQNRRYKELKIAYEEIKAAYEELAKTTYESFNDYSSLLLSKRREEQARKRAELLSNTDYLTGVLNRRAFEKQLDAEINRAGRENLSLGVILTDIDFFKAINDTHGHQVGDEVLKNFADFLSQQCRSYDFVGRFGGEEFVLCLPGVREKQAAMIARRLCSRVRELQLAASCASGIKITASFGVAVLKENESETIDSIIKRADEAMYLAKTEGRDCVRLAS
jgi:diguanylate cyclase (GGDEF)-like protein/PAS domain S-box-containing protein